MQETKVARRYAKSLIDLSQERNAMEQTNRDLELILETLKQSRELRNMLKNPLVNPGKKLEIVRMIFGNKLSQLTISFLEIVIRKRREIYLEDIAQSFVGQYKELKGITTAMVISAVGLDDKLRKEVTALIQRLSTSEVALEEKIDPNLIGGFILRFGDIQYDTSIAKSLGAFRMNFSKNLYQSKLWKK